MVEQVRKYPGEVMIFSGGALTNIALATRLDPQFASLTKGLVIMGGYLDVTLLQTSGSVLQADLSSDVSLYMTSVVGIVKSHKRVQFANCRGRST